MLAVSSARERSTVLRMVEQTWDGATRRATLNPWAADARARLADSAKRYDWAEVFEVVDRHPELVNATRPDGPFLVCAAASGSPRRSIDRDRRPADRQRRLAAAAQRRRRATGRQKFQGSDAAAQTTRPGVR